MSQIVDECADPRFRAIQPGIAFGQRCQRRLQLDAGDVASRHPRSDAQSHGSHPSAEVEDAIAGLRFGGRGEQHRIDRDPVSASGLQESYATAHYGVFGCRGFHATHPAR